MHLFCQLRLIAITLAKSGAELSTSQLGIGISHVFIVRIPMMDFKALSRKWKCRLWQEDGLFFVSGCEHEPFHWSPIY